jgi:phosphoglycolate phosphatase-like HAD superfamily hydrolase
MKAAIFDVDGTLVFHTKEYIRDTVGKTLLELGLDSDEKFVEDFWYCHGSDRNNIIEDRLGIEYMEFWKVFWRYDNPEERAKHTGVYDDVSALINLKRKGLKL